MFGYLDLYIAVGTLQDTPRLAFGYSLSHLTQQQRWHRNHRHYTRVRAPRDCLFALQITAREILSFVRTSLASTAPP